MQAHGDVGPCWQLQIPRSVTVTDPGSGKSSTHVMGRWDIAGTDTVCAEAPAQVRTPLRTKTAVVGPAGRGDVTVGAVLLLLLLVPAARSRVHLSAHTTVPSGWCPGKRETGPHEDPVAGAACSRRNVAIVDVLLWGAPHVWRRSVGHAFGERLQCPQCAPTQPRSSPTPQGGRRAERQESMWYKP